MTGPRDTTRALTIAKKIRDLALEQIQILEAIDARETRLDPSKRTPKRKVG